MSSKPIMISLFLIILSIQASAMSTAEVIKAIGKSDTQNDAIRLTKLAGARPDYTWVKKELNKEELAKIFLPWHQHPAPFIPQKGGLVKKAAEVFNKIKRQYKETSPNCHKSISFFRDHPGMALMTPVILSQGKLKGTDHWDGYDGLPDEEEALYHVDGLHRMIGWYLGSDQFAKLKVIVSEKKDP